MEEQAEIVSRAENSGGTRERAGGEVTTPTSQDVRRAFSLDTSGSVLLRRPEGDGWITNRTFWEDLTPFAQGYVEAMFETASGMNFAHWGAPLSFSMLSPAALSMILGDCERRLAAYGPGDTYTTADGRNFWQRRQHGMTPLWPPLTVSLSEDGKVELSISKTEGR